MNRIKQLREAYGWKQDDLGDRLNVQRAVISKYENGTVSLSDDTLKRLADLFNVSIDYLLIRTDDPTPIRDLDQDSHDELDVESKWVNFLRTLSGDSMFYQYENVDDNQKLAIMEEHKEKMEKKKKKVAKFLKYSDEVIDEALNFAAYNQEQRKNKLDD